MKLTRHQVQAGVIDDLADAREKGRSDQALASIVMGRMETYLQARFGEDFMDNLYQSTEED